LILAGLYAGVLLLVHTLIYRAVKIEGVSLTTFASGALSFMAFIMALVIFWGGANAIKKAVHRDFTTEMITSHRVSAMTGHTAILGYLTGATAQIWALTLVNWIACTVLAVTAGDPAYAPALLLVVFGCLAVMFWTMGTLLALCTRGSTSIGGILVVVAMVAYSPVASLLPGLSFLIGATTVSSLPAAAATGVVDASVFVSMFAQLAFGLAFFLAAARKFARDDVQAFSPGLAYVLLALCSLIAAAALRFWRATALAALSPVLTDLGIQSVTTVSAIALVAFLPVASVAKEAARWARFKAKDPDSRKPPPRATLTGPLLATCIAFGVFAAVLVPMLPEIFPAAEEGEMLRRIGWIGAFFFLSLLAVAGSFRFIYARSDKAIWFVVGYVVLVWVIPPLADLAREFALDRPEGDPRSLLFACSPVGAWVIAFGMATGPLLPGLVVQVLLAVGSLVLARRARY
jgi:hypothetical protein